MTGITSTGIGSGLDVEGIISKLMAAEAQGPAQRLNTRENKLQTELSALGTLKSKLSDFQSSLSGLADATTFSARTSTSSDSSIFTASADSSASAGTHSIEVQYLAQAHKVASSAFADTTSAVGTGTLTFEFGTYDSGTNTFTTNADKATGTVTIDAANNSLAGIRDAVNAAGIGVQASIVNDGTGDRLVFASEDSGAANSLKVTVSGDGDGNDLDNAGLSQLAYDPTGSAGSGKNMTETVAAQDALVTVDGIDVTSSGNSVSGALEGVTLDLASAAPGTTETLTVALDKEGATEAVNSFVDSFNSLVSTLNDLTSYDQETKQAGPLLGDATARGIESQLRSILTDMVPGLSGGVRALVDIGISTQSDGTLSVDNTELQAALDSNFDDVGKLFAAVGSPTDSLVSYKSSTSNTQAGTYAVNVTQLATQGSYTGGAATLTFATDQTFDIKVDGTQSGTITIAAGTYSGSELAAQLQSSINGDTTLKDAGASVTASYDGSGFALTSSSYGSSSTVEVTTANATLGLTAVAGTTGVDVAGTIDGVAATGSGRVLMATSGNADGLQLEVLGGTTGSRGDVVFSRGVADQLDTLLDDYLEFDGLLDSRTTSINDQLSDVSDQRDALQAHLDQVEKRYRAQFTALDAAMGQMQATSNYLSQQLASLPG